MHFHVPKPLHGWREFFGEVGIIVLGVLIALGAEQVIEELHSQSEGKQTREALDAELAHNLASFDYRLGVQACAQERLNELQAIIAQQSRGERVPLKRDFSPPITMNLRFAIWDAASGEAKSHMPLQVKLQYAMLYDIFHGYQRVRERDGDEWNQLADLDLSKPLRADDIRNATIMVKRLRRLDALLPTYSSLLKRSADPLRIHPADDDLDEATRRMMANNRSSICSHLI
jgi:hypothetical protein